MESQDIATGIVVSVVMGVLMFSLLKIFHFSKWQMDTLHIKCSQGDFEQACAMDFQDKDIQKKKH